MFSSNAILLVLLFSLLLRLQFSHGRHGCVVRIQREIFELVHIDGKVVQRWTITVGSYHSIVHAVELERRRFG